MVDKPFLSSWLQLRNVYSEENPVFVLKHLLLTGIHHLNFQKKTYPSDKNEKVIMNSDKVNYRCYLSPVFGQTLEINLIPSKICSFDCIYCKYGKTTQKTIEHIDHIPFGKIVVDIESVLAKNQPLDHIVLSGKGDPALFSGLSLVIKDLKKMSGCSVAVVTCGGLLWKLSIQTDLADADIVLASLDSPDKILYQCINRPHGLVPFQRFFNGMLEFRRMFKGKFWLMVTLLDGMNAVEADIKKMAQLTKTLKPDRILIRTVPSKPVEKFAFPVEHARLQHFADFFGATAVVVDYDEILFSHTLPRDGLPLGMHD